MKKIILLSLLFALVSTAAFSQIKISAMPHHSGQADSVKIPVVINGTNYVIYGYQLMGSNNDSCYVDAEGLPDSTGFVLIHGDERRDTFRFNIQLDTTSLSNRINQKLNITDTVNKWVTSIYESGGNLYMRKNGSNVLIGALGGSSGITSINSLSGAAQTLTTGTSGNDVAVSSAGTTHTINIPDASATARGVVTTGDQTFGGIKTFSGTFHTISGLLGVGAPNPGTGSQVHFLGKVNYANPTAESGFYPFQLYGGWAAVGAPTYSSGTTLAFGGMYAGTWIAVRIFSHGVERALFNENGVTVTKLNVNTGANATTGTATLASGTVTVSTNLVTASSKIFVTYNTPSGTQGFLSTPTGSIVAATSFVINSSSASDNSTVNWWIIN
jgi:hypothetical protein